MQRAVYGCTALAGKNLKGEIPKDEDGYYTVVIGGLNVYNSAGAYYAYESGKALFEASSALMRRVVNGACKAEWGHPKKQPGTTMREYISRILTVDEDNICAHFKEIWLDENIQKDEQGRSIVLILAKVKPVGPKGPYLQEMFDDPNQNVCFSIRSLTDDQYERGVLVKHLRTVVTFDAVIEPGISWAKKWHSPALESLTDDVFISDQMLVAMAKDEEKDPVALESGQLTIHQILSDFNWQRSAQPRSLMW